MSKPDHGMNAIGVLALELAGGDAPRHAALSSEQAGELAERVGRDLAKLVPGCLIGMVHGTIFLLISVLGFGVPFTGSVVLLYLAMLVFAAAAGGVGLMVSSLSATQQQAFLGAFTVGVPCILISGSVTPVMNMPLFLQHASQLNPLRHFTAITQGVFLKDITVAAAAVSLGKITCISIVTVGVAVWMFRRKA